MNLNRQKSSIKKREYSNDKTSRNYFKKKLKEFGLAVPKYLDRSLSRNQFKTLKNKIVKRIEKQQEVERKYAAETKKLEKEIKDSVKRYNERVNIVSEIIQKQFNLTKNDIQYLSGQPVFVNQRNKSFEKDGVILKPINFKRLRFSDNTAMKDFLKIMKKKRLEMNVKNIREYLINNNGATKWFENEYLSGPLFEDLKSNEKESLLNYFNSLSGIKKELVIKDSMNKIKEKYENSEDPNKYRFKAYNQVMSNLINYGKNDEIS